MAAPPPPEPSAPSASPDAVLHLAGLHALAAAGFASTSRAASMTLSSAVAQYFRLVASTCMERASLAGRSKVAAVDVVAALDDLGMHVGELYDWAGEQDEVLFTGHGMDGLETYLRDGLAVQDPIADLKMVHVDDMESEQSDDLADQDEEAPKAERIDEDTVMAEDGVHDEAVSPSVEAKADPYRLRLRSPDLSWLPPLPGSNSTALSQSIKPTDDVHDTTTTTNAATASTPAPIQSIADRYRKPISYASSQLAQTHPFTDPARPSQAPSIPPAPSSLPNLISTYAATASEPSIALRQTDLRRQATDLLRLSIATVDSYSPADTLTAALPPVRASPIVPSHSDILPQRFLPVNPRPNGLLSSLVQQIHSPHLPAALRERLTSLRPPIAQMRDNQPILYGEPIRGPDDAALAKAKGKHLDSEAATAGEVCLQQTWDSGPRGVDKWGRGKLPTGKKVVLSKEGEPIPREPEGSRKREESQKVKLRLPSAGTGGLSASVTPGEPPTSLANGINAPPSTDSSGPAINPDQAPPVPPSAPTSTTPTMPSLKVKFGVKKEPSTPVSEVPPITLITGQAAADPAAITVQQNGIHDGGS